MPRRQIVVAALLAATLLLPAGAQAAPGVQGEVPQLGFGLLRTTEAVSPTGLVANLAQDGCAAVTIGIFPGGQFVGYIPGAPDFVNSGFPDTLAAGTAFVTRCFPMEPTEPASNALADLPEYAVFEAHAGACSWVIAVLPQEAFESGAGSEGRLLFGVSNDNLGHGIQFLTADGVQERGVTVMDGVPSGPATEDCEADETSWTATPVGDGLAVLSARLEASQIWTSALNLAEQFGGVTLTDEVRDALTN